MNSKIIFYCFMVSLSAYASESSSSDYLYDESSSCSSSSSSTQATPLILNLDLVRRIRSNSVSPSPRAQISPRVGFPVSSPREKWQKSHPGQDVPLSISIADKYYWDEKKTESQECIRTTIEQKTKEKSLHNDLMILSLGIEFDGVVKTLIELKAIRNGIEEEIMIVRSEMQDATAILLDREASKEDKANAMNSSNDLTTQLKTLGKRQREFQKEIAEVEGKKNELEEQLFEAQK